MWGSSANCPISGGNRDAPHARRRKFDRRTVQRRRSWGFGFSGVATSQLRQDHPHLLGRAWTLKVEYVHRRTCAPAPAPRPASRSPPGSPASATPGDYTGCAASRARSTTNDSTGPTSPRDWPHRSFPRGEGIDSSRWAPRRYGEDAASRIGLRFYPANPGILPQRQSCDSGNNSSSTRKGGDDHRDQ